MSKIFLYQNFLLNVVHIFPSFPYGSKLLFQVCEIWTDLSQILRDEWTGTKK